jgi:hypothetical protein
MAGGGVGDARGLGFRSSGDGLDLRVGVALELG